MENHTAMSQTQSETPERRQHRRHDIALQNITIDRWLGHGVPQTLGQVVDISATGVRLRSHEKNLKPDQQIRVRLELPVYAGICPFLQYGEKGVTPKNEWVGWITIKRVVDLDEKECEVGGRLLDMDEMDRGMLGLYLSTQPMAA